MVFELLISSIKFGLIYSLAALGFAFSLRILSYADLTAEGTFILGGVISALFIKNELSPELSLVGVIVAGILAGSITSILHCYCHVNKLLSGIITLSILYSVNLRIQGSANSSFYKMPTVFSRFQSEYSKTLFVFVIVLLVFSLFYWLLHTKFGLLLRMCGNNIILLQRNGYNKNIFIILGLSLSNASISLSGALFSQYAGFSDINNASGLIVICLTTVILGEIIVRPQSIKSFFISIIIGSILSQSVNCLCLYLNLYPADYKGIVGIILVILIVLRRHLNTYESIHKQEDRDVEIIL
jgi:putative ABC transport system permease protein